MKRVQLESPFRGNNYEQTELNQKYLDLCIADCVERGEFPYASHKMLTGAFEDTVPELRAKGIEVGLEFLKVAEASVVYIDLGISEGMKQGILKAIALGVPVESRRLPFEVFKTIYEFKKKEEFKPFPDLGLVFSDVIFPKKQGIELSYPELLKINGSEISFGNNDPKAWSKEEVEKFEKLWSGIKVRKPVVETPDIDWSVLQRDLKEFNKPKKTPKQIFIEEINDGWDDRVINNHFSDYSVFLNNYHLTYFNLDDNLVIQLSKYGRERGFTDYDLNKIRYNFKNAFSKQIKYCRRKANKQ